MLNISDPDVKKILEKFEEIHQKCKKNRDISEDKLKSYFHKSGILEELGYEDEDIHIEETVKAQKRTDIHVTDDYGNVKAVIEFKKPTVSNLEDHYNQLWDRYVIPLKAEYGLLYNGFELYFYERIKEESEKIFGLNVLDSERDHISSIISHIEKPRYDLTQISEVSNYLEKFEESEERLNLKDEASKEHFFENFKLKKDSTFGEMLKATIKLFNSMEDEEEYDFLRSAYDFWKTSYAKKPDAVPENWKPIMEDCGLSNSQRDLYKFMFCLETTYALFTRLILAKSAEDYEFADVKFVRFLENKIADASRRGDIPRSAWGKMTQELIRDMKNTLVSSVFEEDIFYWWTEPFEEQTYNEMYFTSEVDEVTHASDSFGDGIRDILLTFCKFDFSQIKGDPLGILYQRYFDKGTRKALGEFYTPQEVVDYILDSVDYKGRKVLDKRLLDPACGSGTFLVTALQRYLKASEEEAKKKGWDTVLDNLCNKYRIVGFDIHPFATIMAQIQFMLVLLPYYKKAVEDNKKFVLMRVPIFRTDSLRDESKSGKISLQDFENGKRISMNVKLPLQEEEGGFFEESFSMPHSGTVLRNTDIYNNEQYFGALQGLFDVVKDQAKKMENKEEIPKFDADKYERVLKQHYLSDKDWIRISSFFESFGNELLEKINRLQSEFDDGRLIKSIEDVFLASLLKNEQKYDFVVGNPPYVRVQNLSKDQKSYLKSTYEETSTGNFDIYCPFYQRGIQWLSDEGLLCYIAPNQFMVTNYGEGLRKFLIKETQIKEILDFRDSGVFKDATNYPAILKLERKSSNKSEKIKCARVKSNIEESSENLDKTVIQQIKKCRSQDNFSNKYLDIFNFPQDRLDDNYWSISPPKEYTILQKMDDNAYSTIENITDSVFAGTQTSANSIYVVEVLDDEIVKPEDKGRVVTIVPSGKNKKYQIEKDLLCPWLNGKDIQRWKPDWKGTHVILPYKIRMKDGELHSKLFSADYLQKNLPLTWKYFKRHRKKLEKRENGKMKGREDWYSFIYPKSHSRFEKPKIIGAEISDKAKFIEDSEGVWYFKTAYGLQLKDPSSENTKVLVGLLNSNPLDFYLKHITSIKSGGYYKYMSQYLEKLPIAEMDVTPIKNKVDKISKIIEMNNKTKRFPFSYLQNIELTNLSMKCDSSHTKMTPIIQQNKDGMFGIVIGKRKKEDPILVDTEEKAEFVQKALQGDSVKKGGELEILIPKSNQITKKILKEYKKDKEELEEMPTIEELEEEINQIVYDLYGLDEKDVEVIEDFLEKF